MALFGFFCLVVGLIIGGTLFSDTKPRSLFALRRCDNCLHPNEILGLVASVGIQKTPGLLPSVVLETDKTIALKHPTPAAKHHFVIIPKKDIKNIGEASEEDREYLADILAVGTELVRTNGLKRYRLWTNGPDNQIVAYLHFHLAGS